MQKNALRNYAQPSKIDLPFYSGYRGAWTQPEPTPRALATARLKAHRKQGPRIGRWILAAAAAASAAALKGATC